MNKHVVDIYVARINASNTEKHPSHSIRGTISKEQYRAYCIELNTLSKIARKSTVTEIRIQTLMHLCELYENQNRFPYGRYF